jgi:ribosomal protein S18 acetylase RimI-like enzyme
MIRARAAREADAQKIADIYIETWRTTYAGSLPDRVLIGMSNERQAVYWTRAIRSGGEIVGVAEDDEAGIVAVGSAGTNRSRSSTLEGEVYTLYVQPDFQNQGIGEQLLAFLFGEIKTRGLRSAVIWVLAANPSRFFYETMGGKRVGEREEEMWGVKLREIAYGWPDLDAALKAGRPRVR